MRFATCTFHRAFIWTQARISLIRAKGRVEPGTGGADQTGGQGCFGLKADVPEFVARVERYCHGNCNNSAPCPSNNRCICEISFTCSTTITSAISRSGSSFPFSAACRAMAMPPS